MATTRLYYCGMTRRGFGAISDVAASEFLHRVGGSRFFIYDVPVKLAKYPRNWSFRCTSGVMDVDVGTWRSCRWRGVIYLLIVPEILAVMVTKGGGYHDLACFDFWKWDANMLSKRRSAHVRVTLKTLGSPLRHVFGQCIHVSWENPWIMGQFYWWRSIVKLQRWATREVGERSKKLGGSWYGLGIQSRSKNKRYYWAWLRK